MRIPDGSFRRLHQRYDILKITVVLFTEAVLGNLAKSTI